MNRPVITPREALLWLLLILVCGVFLSVVWPSSHLRPEAVAFVMGKDGSEELFVPVAVSRVAHADRQMDLAAPICASVSGTFAMTDDSGEGEMPFAAAATAATDAAAAGPADAAALCAALCNACASGSGADLVPIRTRLVAMGTAAIPALSGLLQCGNDKTEIEAVRLLVQIGDLEGLARALGKMLTVPRNSAAYSSCLAAMADNRSEAVAQWVADALGRTPSGEMRERMLDLLAALRRSGTVAALEQAARAAADDMQARDILNILATRNAPIEADELARLLESGDAEIETAAAFGLAHIGSRETCRILADFVKTHSGSAAALASVSSAYAQEALLALATSPTKSEIVRTAAIQALAGPSSSRTRVALANAVIQETNPVVLAAMQTALAGRENHDGAEAERVGTSGADGEWWF